MVGRALIHSKQIFVWHFYRGISSSLSLSQREKKNEYLKNEKKTQHTKERQIDE